MGGETEVVRGEEGILPHHKGDEYQKMKN